MNILPYQTADSSHNLTSRAGLAVLAELMAKLKLGETLDRAMPVAGSNRGYAASTVFNTFMLLLHEGGRCLDDVRHLKCEPALMKLFGFKRVPDAHTLGNWLRRIGDSRRCDQALDAVNRQLLKAALGRCRAVTLDIDATVIESHKREAKWTYRKHPGYAPMVGHISETEQVAAVEFRTGNVSPRAGHVRFVRRCQAALPDGVSVTRLRADAAGFQAELINYARQQQMGFAVRAAMDSQVKQSIAAIQDKDWQPLAPDAHGKPLSTSNEQVAFTVHVMADTPEAFGLVVQRRKIGEQAVDEPLQLDLFGDGFVPVDGQCVRRGVYLYRAIATNLDGHGFSCSDVVHWYNQRAECSENRLKELRSDFAGARLPCGQFHANAAYFKLAAIACNLMALLRAMLPAQWGRSRAITVRWRYYAMAGQIVRHARQWTLKVNPECRIRLTQAIGTIRTFQFP